MSIFSVTTTNSETTPPRTEYLPLEDVRVNTLFIKFHDTESWGRYYVNQFGVKKYRTWYGIEDPDEKDIPRPTNSHKNHLICNCREAVWIRGRIKEENKMADISPEKYREAFNEKKKGEFISKSTDEELEAHITWLEEFIREVNMETRAAVVERSERSLSKREKIRLVDTTYKIKEVVEERKSSKPPQSKEDRMKQKQIEDRMKIYISKGMTEFDARSKAEEKVAALWED